MILWASFICYWARLFAPGIAVEPVPEYDCDLSDLANDDLLDTGCTLGTTHT